MKTGSILSQAIILSCVFGLIDLPAARCAEPGKTMVGTQAINFSCLSVENQEFRLEETLKSKSAVLISFWGLRCGECIEEIPALNRIYGQYGPKGLEVVGINIDGASPSFLKEMITKMGLDIRYQVLADSDLSLMNKFAVEAAPTTILVRKDMRISYYHVGFKEGDETALGIAIVEELGK